MFDPGAEIGDQTEPLTGLFQHGGIDPVSHGRDDYVAVGHGGDQFGTAERPVLDVEDHIEQFAHPGFDRRQQVAGHMDPRLAGNPAVRLGVSHDGHAAIARPGQGGRSSGLNGVAGPGYQGGMISVRRFLPVIALLGFAIPALAQDTADTPYWASVRVSEVNMRVGPGEDYRILWVYRRPQLPLKVLRIKEGWRFVRDPDGAQGWVLARFLTRQRTAYVQGKEPAEMREGAGPGGKLLWRLSPGIVGQLGDCDQGWCGFTAGPRKGYVPQDRLWGAGEP